MKNIISILLLLLIPFVSLVATLSAVAKQTVLQPQFIKQTLGESGLYQLPFTVDPEIFLEGLIEARESSQESEQRGAPTEEMMIKQEILSSLIKDVQRDLAQQLGPQFLRERVEPLIDGLYAWLLGKTTQLQLFLSIPEQERLIIAAIVEEHIFAYMQTLPACDQEGLRVWETQGWSLSCVPSGLQPAQLQELVQQNNFSIQELVFRYLPTTVDLSAIMVQSEAYPQLLLLREYIMQISLVVAASWLLLIGILFLVGFLHWPATFFRWMGIMLTYGFLMPAALGGFLKLVVSQVTWQRVQGEVQASIPPVILELLFSLVQNLVDGIASWLLLVAGPLCVLGLLLIFTRHSHQQTPTPPTPN